MTIHVRVIQVKYNRVYYMGNPLALFICVAIGAQVYNVCVRHNGTKVVTVSHASGALFLIRAPILWVNYDGQ